MQETRGSARQTSDTERDSDAPDRRRVGLGGRIYLAKTGDCETMAHGLVQRGLSLKTVRARSLPNVHSPQP